MNRQQRRAALKRRPSANRGIAPMASWALQQIAMLKSDLGDVPEEDKQQILIPAHLCLNKLQFGGLDEGDFLYLCQVNGIAGELALSLSDKDASGQLANAAQACVDAADALGAIYERHDKTGRYVAKADELQHIKTSIQILTDLLNISSRGAFISALDVTERQLAAHGKSRVYAGVMNERHSSYG